MRVMCVCLQGRSAFDTSRGLKLTQSTVYSEPVLFLAVSPLTVASRSRDPRVVLHTVVAPKEALEGGSEFSGLFLLPPLYQRGKECPPTTN